jgi:hypothetical protein
MIVRLRSRALNDVNNNRLSTYLTVTFVRTSRHVTLQTNDISVLSSLTSRCRRHRRQGRVLFTVGGGERRTAVGGRGIVILPFNRPYGQFACQASDRLRSKEN